jgi:hypothetical protein
MIDNQFSGQVKVVMIDNQFSGQVQVEPIAHTHTHKQTHTQTQTHTRARHAHTRTPRTHILLRIRLTQPIVLCVVGEVDKPVLPLPSKIGWDKRIRSKACVCVYVCVCVCVYCLRTSATHELDSTGFDSSTTSRVAFWF